MFFQGRCNQCFKHWILSPKNYERMYKGTVLLINWNCPLALPRTGARFTGNTLPSVRCNSSISATRSHCNQIKYCDSCKHGIFTCSAYETTFLIRSYSTRRLTHYQVLGLEQNASTEDVRAAFLKKSKECHPDTNIKDPNNHKQFVLVNEAYSILSKPLSRRDYDLSLRLGRTVQTHRRPTMDSDHYYHYPRGFYEEEINAMRNRSRGGERSSDTKNHSYYGIPGIDKLSNSKIVVICLVWMLIGIIVHTIAVAKSSETHLKLLDERDATAHKIMMEAKRSGEIFKSERALERREKISTKDSD